MVERLNNMKLRGEDQILAKPGEVLCDICPELKLKAQKTCMECLVSFCQAHLEPHLRVTALKKHMLTDPVSNLEERICKSHGKVFELFCRTDETCICFMCLKDNHVMHETVPVEHVFWERKALLENVTSQMKMMEDTKTRNITEMKHSIEERKKELDKEMAGIDEVFAALVASLQRRKAKLMESIQETEKAAEKQVEDHVTQLEQQAKELRNKRSKMEHLLQTEDGLHFLLSLPSLNVPAFNQELFHTLSSFTPTPPTHDLSDSSQQSYSEIVTKAVAQMDNTLSNEMEMLIHKVQLSDGCESTEHPAAAASPVTDEFINEAWSPPQDNLMMIQQCNAVDVTLDARTVHPRLIMSDDKKELRVSQSQLQMFFRSILGDRLDGMPMALGKDGYSSGRFYYEVQVNGSNSWILSVVKEPFKYDPRCDTFKWGWSLFCHSNDSFILSVDTGPLFVWQMPQTVGVFVDYEKGEVSFYDVGARTLIHSYTGCDFTENVSTPVGLLYSLAGYPLGSRQKLYPVFGLHVNNPDNVLRITPVCQFRSV